MRRRAVAAGVVALVLAGEGGALAHPPAGSVGGGPVASAASDEETILTRRRFFGQDNVDPTTGAVRRDRLILSWFGVTNFALAIRGHVVLLDAWIPRGAHSGYVPASPAELAKLRPEAIIIGHGHFDHAADAVPIALASGATLVGTAEHCSDFRSRAPAMPPPCVAAVPAGADPGTLGQLSELLRGVEITAVKHLHSASRRPDGTEGYHVPVMPLPSLTALEHPPTPADLAHLLGVLPDAEGGSVLYRFRVGDMSFVWNDSAGPLATDAPGVLGVLRSLRPVDLHVGAIQGFNQITNGLRDPRKYIEALAPRTFVPAHHDDWAAGITTRGAAYEQPLTAELERIPAGEPRPTVRFIRDPADYVRPAALTFPVALEPVALTRRCVRGGRLRVGLRGDLADVAEVRFALGRRGATRGAPFTLILPRSRARRLRASVRCFDGTRERLSRRAPRCGG